ncbi:MAG: hypothetical protein IJ071_03800 [Ruminococcus sp.]|nr:hypothetical protein [Ruminococcus sp.]
MDGKNSKCPFCGAGLDLSRAVKGVVKCEYCDSEIDIAPPPQRSTAPDPVPEQLKQKLASEQGKNWQRSLRRAAVAEFISTVVMGICLSLDVDGLAVLSFIFAVVFSFAAPGVIAGKYPKRSPDGKGGMAAPWLFSYIILCGAFWAGVFVAAAISSFTVW